MRPGVTQGDSVRENGAQPLTGKQQGKAAGRGGQESGSQDGSLSAEGGHCNGSDREPCSRRGLERGRRCGEGAAAQVWSCRQ